MITIREFEKKYIKAIQEGYAAIFAGAGLSVPSGYVDWKNLLKDIAEDIQLDVEKEYDLIEVAQFYCNEMRSRNEINNRILNYFVTNAKNNKSLEILSELNISTYWTTNYDHLIEDVLKRKGKKIDVKITSKSLSSTLEDKDAIIYKMHGDYIDPSTCVITKDDYETYNQTRQLFSTALQGDLVSKTFLFIGFSFEDPNLKYILSRIRNLLDTNQRIHYCFLEKKRKKDYICEEDFIYAQNKQSLKIHDLMRYGIQTVLLDNYNEIPKILKYIKTKAKSNCIFISGAAEEYGIEWEEKALLMIRKLIQTLYSNKYKIITGHAKGIGSYIISTILEECKFNMSKLEKHLIIKGFPYEDKKNHDYQEIVHKYRTGIFSLSGISIFLFGNKIEKNELKLSNGMYEEYKLAKKAGNYLIPVGSTGYMSKVIFNEIKAEIENYPYLKSEIDILEKSTDVDELIESILTILHNIQNFY